MEDLIETLTFLLSLDPAMAAKTIIPTSIYVLFLSLGILFVSAVGGADDQPFISTLPRSSLGLKQEKLSHLHFYFHDILSGRNPTTIKIVEALTTNASSTGFGLVAVMDDPLTVGPEMSSKIIGKAQGIHGSASQTELGLLMVLTFSLVEGKYNGSTLSLLGKNRVLSEVREMPIVGGSGVFRFARGYAQARTYSFNLKTGDAVVEYNVYVFHY